MQAMRRALDFALRPDPGAGRSRDSSGVRAVGMLVVAGAVFGAAMGAYAGEGAPRVLQVLYSAAKVPLLQLVTFALCVPSFFVLGSLLGLRADMGRALAALLRVQLVLAVVLASCAPYTLLWYASFRGHDAAVLFNGCLFGAASLGAQFVLRRLYRPLIDRDRRHRIMVWAWLVLFAFVGIQMAWVLRPFVGSPGLETRFFREDSWTNAYVWLAGAAMRAMP